jgi:hypothetical protein
MVSIDGQKEETGFPTTLITYFLSICACLMFQDMALVQQNIVECAAIMCNLERLLNLYMASSRCSSGI